MAENTITQDLARCRTVREFTDASIGKEALVKLLWAAQGAEGKRTSPSAHGIRPLRLFVVVDSVDCLSKGLFEVDRAGLGLKNVNRSDLSPALRRGAIGDPPWITEAACIIAICADTDAPNREFADQKPYGEHGARYPFLEAGVAAQNLHLQAVAENQGCVWVGGFDDDAAADVLSLKAPINPIILVCVGHPASAR